LLFPLAVISTEAQNNAAREWPAYGRDAGGGRYSPLSQVNDEETWRSSARHGRSIRAKLDTYTGTDALSKAAFEATPLMIGHTLYFSTPSDRGICHRCGYRQTAVAFLTPM